MRATYHDQDRQVVASLRELIIFVLMEIQKGLCASCNEPHRNMDIDHKRYGADVTIYDLQLLCRSCHCKKHPNVPILQHA